MTPFPKLKPNTNIVKIIGYLYPAKNFSPV
jgi:hypothetical protein